ncbi:hypothetical protein CAPTEDRAFT_197041 [Capitella teleta]|uniref:Odorant receptor n=1 Tax=Capitella teleta TaxID=283909 RepID=R7V6G1_CAPTE|nr:hypothetical protein CAPTEDRAFT_197041 [Capitella teleta]|eukprot:ELU14052.1 hypothetical protein CAPTEDRAFT_197041 [Capitella teleta]
MQEQGHNTDREDPKPKFEVSCNELFDSMRWLVTAMKCFGMIHFDNSSAGEKLYSRWSFSKIYQLVVMILFALNQIRLVPTLVSPNRISPQFLAEVLAFSWMLMTLAFSVAMFKVCNNRNVFIATLISWKNFNPQPSPEKIVYFTKKCRRYVAFVMLSFPVNIGVVIGGLISSPSFDFVLVPLSPDNEFINLARCAYVVLHIYLAGYYTMTIVLTLLLADISHYELKQFNAQFRRCITEDGNFIADFEERRRQHHRICVFIGKADATVSLSVGFSFVLNLLQILVGLYVFMAMSDIKDDVFMIILASAWIVGAVFTLGLMMVFCAYVNLEISVLLSRLTGSSIGFTACSMFVIDKSIFLTERRRHPFGVFGMVQRERHFYSHLVISVITFM